jgi:uncharacterized protein YutE (UPF0331/DUF86 family)
MYDVERLGKILSDIERYFSDLETLNVRTEKDLEDRRNFYSVSMVIFSIINRTINLGEEVVTANNLGTPSTYKDIFFLLRRAGIINEQMKTDLSELSSYRNLFSHEYQNLTEKDVYAALMKIGAVRDFVKRIKARMKEQQK